MYVYFYCIFIFLNPVFWRQAVLEWLGQKENPDGRGWAAGAGYGEKILVILKGILGMTGGDVFRPYLVWVSIPICTNFVAANS